MYGDLQPQNRHDFMKRFAMHGINMLHFRSSVIFLPTPSTKSLYLINFCVHIRSIGWCLKKVPPPLLLTKQGYEVIKYRDFLSSSYLLIFNLNAHTFHFEIVLPTPEIRVHKVELWSALETRD